MSIKPIIIAAVIVQGLPLMADEANPRVITVSSVCLLHGDKYRNADYALSMVEEACTRLANDLVVTPLMAAKEMNAYIIIGGIGVEDSTSVAHVWNREGKVVFKESIYWKLSGHRNVCRGWVNPSYISYLRNP